MRNENSQQSPKLSARMVEPEETERLNKRAREIGLIVNAGAADGKEARPAGNKKDN